MTIPKPKQPQPLPKGGGWRLTPEELEALRNPPPKPKPKPRRSFKAPPKAPKAPPKPPTLAECLAPHLSAMRSASELRLDRLSAYRLALSPSAMRDLLRDAVRMRSSCAILERYSTTEAPTLADMIAIDNNIDIRTRECDILKERALTATARECDILNERIAYLQAEIATFSLVLGYVKKTLKLPEKTEIF